MKINHQLISPYCYPGLKYKNTFPKVQKEIHLGSYRENKFRILEMIANMCLVPVESIISNCRRRSFTDARHIFCAVVRLKYDTTLCEIGRDLNNRDHTSVRHALIKFKERYYNEQSYKNICDKIFSLLDIEYKGQNLVGKKI